MDTYVDVLKKYTVFTGRADRSEYWMFVLVNFIIMFVLNIPDSIIFGVIALLYSLGVLLPSIGVGIRRLHDTGRSGWWLLISLIPIIGAIVLIIFLVQDSEAGTNKYGANPKGVTETPVVEEAVVEETTEEAQEDVVINDIPIVSPEKLDDGVDDTSEKPEEAKEEKN